MFTLTLSIGILLIISVKFGHCTPPTQYMYDTSSTPSIPPSTTSIPPSTTAPDNQRCEPPYIKRNISDDLPKGDNSTEIKFFCDNWGNKRLRFDIELTYDENRFFLLKHFHVGNISYLALEIQDKLKIKDWNTYIHVVDLSTNAILNRVPFNISSIEMNDPPTLTLYNFMSLLPENASIGALIARLQIFDPDTGIWGQVKLTRTDVYEDFVCYNWTNKDVEAMGNFRSQEDERHRCEDVLGYTFTMAENEEYPNCAKCWCCKPIGLLKEFELLEDINNHSVIVRTQTALDADKYWNNSKTFGAKKGPSFNIRVQVRDGGGLAATTSVHVTIKDIDDNKPVCKKNTLTIETELISQGDKVDSLNLFCSGQNYGNRTVKYALIADNCTVFNINTVGEVVLRQTVGREVKSCNVTVQASDVVFPHLATNFSVIIRFLHKVLTCPEDIDYVNMKWNTAAAGTTSFQNCPPGNNGNVSRYCNENGVYQNPVYKCTKSAIDNIYKKLIDDVKKGNVDVIEVLDSITNATSDPNKNGTLFIGDIDTTLNTLSTITDVITENTTLLENITNSFIATVNNILDESTSKTWTVNLNETGTGATIVMKNTDRFVEKIMTTSKNITAEISKPNLYLNIGAVQSCREPMNFPKRESEGVSDWARSRQDELVIQCDDRVESFSGIMYRNLSKIVSVRCDNTKSERLQLNAPVISFTFYPNIKRKLAKPVEIKFQLYNNSWDDAKCSFWKEPHDNTTPGYWSDEGCRHKTDEKNKDVVICICDHLTNFAVLMSPSSNTIDEDHKNALSIISLVGCVVSLVCLVLTIVIHAYFWRFIKSVRSIIHLNLSCSLIIAYILFLAGINQTENKDVCTAMAVLLHLAFLIVIFGMLTEGCNLSYTVLKPLSTRKPGIPMLIVSYVLAIIIVVVSMGSSKLEGYGTEKACWLSTDTGLIWAFLAPVLVVILINVVIVILVIRTMCNTTAMSKKSNKGRAQAALRCLLILMPVMGLTWIFGAFSVNEDTVLFQYLFAILNSFQGLLIFLFHCLMDKKIKDAFMKQRSKWFTTQSFGVSEGRRLKTQDTSDL